MKKIAALILVMLLTGCSATSSTASAQAAVPTGKEIPGLTWESSMELEYATEFAVDYYSGGYARIEVVGDCEYLVVPENMPVPENLDGARFCGSRWIGSTCRRLQPWRCSIKLTVWTPSGW